MEVKDSKKDNNKNMENEAQKQEGAFAAFFDKRSTKYGTNTIILLLAVFGILVLVNFIAEKRITRIDLTENRQFALSEQSENIVKSLEEEVRIIGFYPEGSGARQQLTDLAKEYTAKNDKITLEFIDPLKSPAEANRYNISRTNTIVLEKGDKREEVNAATETDITSGILQISRDERKKVYFLTGHGEKQITGEDPSKSYVAIRAELEKQVYDVSELSLLTEENVPDDTDVLIIAGPEEAIAEKERDAIKRYINEKNGKVLFMLDPVLEVKNDAALQEMLNEFGLSYDGGIVVDPQKNFFGDVTAPLVDEFETHQTTQSQNVAFFPGSAVTGKAESVPEGWAVTELAKSSAGSWLETDLTSEEAAFDEDQDTQGPLSLAAVANEVEPTDKEENAEDQAEEKARVVLVGDSDFVLDTLVQSDLGLANRDLFINMVNWLASEEDLIAIPPKNTTQPQITITGNQYNYIFIGTVLVMPAVVAVIGTYVVIKRRRKRKKKIKSDE